MISIRRQLTRELLRAVLLLLGGGLTGLYFAARNAAIEQFDVALQAKARAVGTLTFQAGDLVRVAFSDRFLPGFEDRNPRDFFQLWDAQGREIARSDSLVPPARLARRVGTLQDPEQWDFTLPTGRPGRAVGFAFRPKLTDARDREAIAEVQLVVATDREELDETLWELLGLCVGLAVLLVGVTLWVIPRVLRRGLAPLDRLGDQAVQIDADSLSTRFAAGQLPAELQPIAQRLNDLLARLEQSFERERRFSADLAHELRTPLAELRSLAECALKWPASREAAVDRETLAIAQQMERIVAHILALARGEQGQLAVTLQPVALEESLRHAWRPFAGRAEHRGLAVVLELAAVEGVADRVLLQSVLHNLFENAVDYAAPSGAIRVELRAAGAEAAISVSNAANDLCPEDLPRLFDRFWRKEESRSGGRHLGLGLSLSRAFARAMGWTLTAQLEPDRRVCFTLRGPVAGGVVPQAAEPAPDVFSAARR